ncbi:MAG: tRNA pseudouridine(38-40) synthase TruA [Gracilimonas sp.]|uniref:tRNA pseudouridine(38-40) synthase TruA n=1 Tax=Gracilimonas sp. TaxID=1974203 RepID=UPI001998CDD5|nr:tRNA pseudouridine(38-40) synthase TruA [Gracilimonas sp.]MBD3615401.1 tRNA pseudouridine(38-40) synthase TruA [Gracilimonas sp.]
MPRYKLTIEYDGTHFSGWQIQPNDKTVEQTLEDAFSQILQRPVDLIGQGRTDAGVHARGQVAHVDLPDETNLEKLIFGVNGMAGEEIQIVEYEPIADDFHARFDAIGREYVYTITQKPIPLRRHLAWSLRQQADMNKLHECAALLKGEFDFSGFSKFNEDNYTTLCEIQRSEFEAEGEIIRYNIRANRFLRNMVRRLVGTMVRVAQGKMSKEEFIEALENPGSSIPTFTAPAKGLVLEKVFYKK